MQYADAYRTELRISVQVEKSGSSAARPPKYREASVGKYLEDHFVVFWSLFWYKRSQQIFVSAYFDYTVVCLSLL